MILDQINLDNPNRLFLKGEQIDIEEAVSSQVINVDRGGRISILRCPYCGSKDFYTKTDKTRFEKPKDDGAYVTGFDIVSSVQTIMCGRCEEQLGPFSGLMLVNADHRASYVLDKAYFLKEVPT